MPFKSTKINREYQKKWATNNRNKHREHTNELVRLSYERMKKDPERLEKWKKYRREYYIKNRRKIIDYGINHFRFGDNREKVFERDNNRCQICLVEKVGKNILIHHIDGNGRGSKTPNNDIDNLILLCQSCHSVIHKFNKVKNNPLFNKLVNSL